jgi:hypothetical protein
VKLVERRLPNQTEEGISISLYKSGAIKWTWFGLHTNRPRPSLIAPYALKHQL